MASEVLVIEATDSDCVEDLVPFASEVSVAEVADGNVVIELFAGAERGPLTEAVDFAVVSVLLPVAMKVILAAENAVTLVAEVVVALNELLSPEAVAIEVDAIVSRTTVILTDDSVFEDAEPPVIIVVRLAAEAAVTLEVEEAVTFKEILSPEVVAIEVGATVS